jgi:hypothetical protein
MRLALSWWQILIRLRKPTLALWIKLLQLAPPIFQLAQRPSVLVVRLMVNLDITPHLVQAKFIKITFGINLVLITLLITYLLLVAVEVLPVVVVPADIFHHPQTLLETQLTQ